MSVLIIVATLVLSAGAFSVSNLITKLAIQRLHGSGRGYNDLLFIYQATSVILLLAIWMVNAETMLIPSLRMTPILLVTGISGAVSLIVIYKGLSLGRMSIIFPLANASPIITFMLAVGILDESPGILGWTGVVLTTVGILALGLENGGVLRLRKELLYGIASLIAWGVHYFAITPLVTRFGILGGTFYASFAVLIVLIPWIHWVRDSQISGFQSYIYGSAIGVSGGIGLVLYSVAVTMGPTSIVNPFHAAIISLLSIVAGIAILDESIERHQLLSLGVITIGAIVLSFTII